MCAVNLAAALAAHQRLRVGLLDADTAGPSIPAMMRLQGHQPAVTADSQQLLVPLENHGVKCMSMGFLVAESKALAWRGPMVGKALEQLLFGVAWGALDVLLVDLPPGTGVQMPLLCCTAPCLQGSIVVARLASSLTRLSAEMLPPPCCFVKHFMPDLLLAST